MLSNEDHGSPLTRLEIAGEQARNNFERAHEVREAGLRSARRIIQLSSKSIRATHRRDFELAEDLCQSAKSVLEDAQLALKGFPQIYYAGFMRDAEKEYVEAAITLSLVSGEQLPYADDLGTSQIAYLNGLSEAASELRRSALDALRQGKTKQANQLLDVMDDIFGVLETVDFPDAITGGLRRSMDQLRPVIERTRGDVTQALRLADLERELESFSTRFDK